jgi:predicted Fe-Mo cluster-binding NifX family protein
MKIAISAQERDLSSPVACHFGRCCYFFIYDEETGNMELVENCEKDNPTCPGQSILDCLVKKNVNHIISAEFGEKTQKQMVMRDIKMTLLTDCSKTVGDILHIIKSKNLNKIKHI